MSTTKPQLKTYIDEEYYNKFKTIASNENRTVSNYLKKLVLDEINTYEKKNGNINIDVHHNETVNINN